MLFLLSLCLFSRWSCFAFSISKEVCSGALSFVVCCVELCSSPKRRGLMNPIKYCLPPLLKLKLNCLLSGSMHSNCAKKKKRKYRSPCLNYRCQKCGNLRDCFPELAHEKYNFLFPFISSLCTPGGKYFKDAEGKNDGCGFLPHHCSSSNKNYK